MKFVILSLFVLIMTQSCIQENFNTSKCGDKFLHVYYGGGVGGYRLVVLNNQESMMFSGIDDYEKFKQDDTPKLIYENENRIFVTCGKAIQIITSSEPLINTLLDNVIIEVLEPAQLFDIDNTMYDIVIR